jgi:hypothetical protein
MERGKLLMKIFFIIVAALLPMTSFAEWQFIYKTDATKSNDGLMVYINTDIKKSTDKNYISVWENHVPIRSDENLNKLALGVTNDIVGNSMYKTLINCKEKTYALVFTVSYDVYGKATTDDVEIDSSNAKFRSIIPDTQGELLRNTACSMANKKSIKK